MDNTMTLVAAFLSLMLLASVYCATTEETNAVTEIHDELTTIALPQEETFEDVEKKLKKSVGSMIRKMLPYLLESGSQSGISGPCSSSIMKMVGGVRNLKEWAFRFLDATGKIPPGILEGTSLSLGDYDQCLDIAVGKKESPPETETDVDFTGQYCLLEVHRPAGINRAIDDYLNGNKESPIAKTKTFLNIFVRYRHLSNSTFKLGVCIPSKCTPDDLQNVLNSVQFGGKLEVAYCKIKGESERTLEQNILIGIFGFIGCCMILGTLVDIVMRCRNEENTEKKQIQKPNALAQLIRSTSLYSNALDLFDTSKQHEPLRVLCGLRVITVLLTIYSHTYGHIHDLHFQKFSKPANFIKFFESFTFSGIANGSVGMDTVIFMSGVTITYTRWRQMSEKGIVKLRLVDLVLRRYFRLSAAQLLAIGLFLLVPLFGSGPIWSVYIDPMLDNCKERWWLNVLFIGNFWSSKVTCIYHTWVLAVIMQLTVLSVLIIWILKRSAKVGVIFIFLLICGGIIGVAIMTIVNDLPGTMAFFMLDIRTGPITWRHVYILAYDHVGSFCIGLLTGYFLALKKDKLKMNPVLVFIGWCLAFSCNLAVMFGLYRYRHGNKMGTSLSTFYAVAHRNAWALGIAWIVIACSTGHGGAINRVLVSNAFLPLDRLCYMAFLLHIPLMFFHSASLRERWYMGHLEMMFLATSYIVMSFILSFITYITCVKPFYYLESQITSYFAPKERLSVTKSTDTHIPQTTNIATNKERRLNEAYNKNVDGI